MAQSGYTPILIYASGTATNVPLAANLTSSASGAELALNYADGKLFYKDSSNAVQVLASKGSGSIGGSNTQIQFNSSGSLAGSASLTWDGTNLLTNNITSAAATNLLLKSAGTTAVTIDTSQNVGIGTSSPAHKLDVTGQGRATTGFAVSTDGSTFTPSGLNAVPNYGIGYITSTLQTALSGFGGIPFYTNQIERMRILSSGNILSLAGGSTTTTGTGIAFPATQSASSDSNTLDDYEEGTWTPNQGAGLTLVGAFGSSALYTKTGRQVTVTGLLTGATSIASSTGGALCSNLPFTCPTNAVGGVADANGFGGSCVVGSTTLNSYPNHAASPGIYFSVTYFV